MDPPAGAIPCTLRAGQIAICPACKQAIATWESHHLLSAGAFAMDSTRFSWSSPLLGLALLICVPIAGLHAQTHPDTCIDSYVWREAFPGDHVCVTPDIREHAATDNQLADSRREPQGGAYGPDTCRPGFVWREAGPEDRVCVTPEARSQTALDNGLATERRLQSAVTTASTSAAEPAAVARSAAKEDATEMRPRSPTVAAVARAPELAAATGAVMATPPRTGETATIRSITLPNFPWPPPPPSARLKLDHALLVSTEPAPTYGSVAARLERALLDNDYTQVSYYAVPDGFAIVTQIERIDPDLSPALEQRWSTHIDAVSLVPFNLEAYIKALLGNDGESFRVIVFVLSSEAFTTDGVRVDPDDAIAWMDKGATALPGAIAAKPYGIDMVCYGLVYEFRISSLGAALQSPSEFSGKDHLRAAGILGRLELAP